MVDRAAFCDASESVADFVEDDGDHDGEEDVDDVGEGTVHAWDDQFCIRRSSGGGRERFEDLDY